MKKLFGALFFIILISVVLTLSVSAESVKFTQDGITYSLDTETMTASITSVDKSLTEINIPTTVSDGYTVTAIGKSAFSGCKMETVIIPDTITEMGESAFSNTNIKNVVLGKGITAIPTKAFYYSSIETINIHEGVTSLGVSAFHCCSSLRDIGSATNVIYIGNNCFNSAHTINSIPGEVIIGDYLFSYSGTAKEYTVPSGIHKIYSSAFSDATSLEKVILSEGVFEIGSFAFNRCSNLKEVVVPSTLKTIWGFAFNECPKLTEFKLNEGLNYIGERAFYHCVDYRTSYIPKTVTFVSYLAFNRNTMTEYNGIWYIGDCLLYKTSSKSVAVRPGTRLIADLNVDNGDIYIIPNSVKYCWLSGGEEDNDYNYIHIHLFYHESWDPIQVYTEGTNRRVHHIKFSHTFSDVKESSWYIGAVSWAKYKGYMNGTGKNLFKPNGILTREQLVQILFNMKGVNPESYSGPSGFKDVPAGKWYSAAIKWAKDNNIIIGTSNDTFGLGEPMTRESVALVLYRYYGYDDFSANGSFTDKFTDKEEISDWALEAVEVITGFYMMGTTGSEGKFEPKKSITRAEMAQILTNPSKIMIYESALRNPT